MATKTASAGKTAKKTTTAAKAGKTAKEAAAKEKPVKTAKSVADTAGSCFFRNGILHISAKDLFS